MLVKPQYQQQMELQQRTLSRVAAATAALRGVLQAGVGG
jgi:hypothetical protein